MRNGAVGALLFSLLLIGSLSGGVLAQQAAEDPDRFTGEPRLDAYAPDPTLTPGGTSELRIQIANDGRVLSGSPQERRDLVTTARNVRVEVDSGGTPIEVESGRQSIGSVTENEPRSVSIDVTVPEGVEGGTYSVDVELRYAYTRQIAPASSVLGARTKERSRVVTRSVDVEVDEAPRFELRNLSTDARIGDSGTLTATVENVGGEAATDARLALTSASGKLVFGETARETGSVGDLGPGERTTVEYDVDVSAEAGLREYPFTGTVEFTDPDGTQGVDDGLSASVTPREEQSFAFEDVTSDLRVSQDGTLGGTLVNEGPGTVENVVVTLEPPARNVEVLESEVAVGSLEPGEAVNVTFDVEVASGARAGQRSFDLRTDYETAEGDARTADPIGVDARIEAKRDVFAVTAREATVAAGDTDRVVLEVTNQRGETVTDVSAKLFASSPLSAPDDEAFVAELEAGETVEIPFRVGVDGGAMTKDYPLSVDFQYVDAAGETRLSESYRVPVGVEEDDGGIFGFLGSLGPLDSLGPLSLAVGVFALLPLGAYYRCR